MKNRTSLVVLLLIYGLACVTPAFGRDTQSTLGIVCLIMLPWVLVAPYWWANPLFFAGCVALARGNAKLAFGLGIAASMLAASFFACFGGLEMARVGSGFWIASMVGLAVVGHFARRADFKPGKPVGLDEW